MPLPIPQSARRVALPGAGEAPPPPAPGLWDSITASFRLNEDEQDLFEQTPRNAQAYRDALDKLHGRGVDTSETGPLFSTADSGTVQKYRIFNRDAIFAEMARQNALSPGVMGDLPKSRSEYDQQIATRFGGRAKDQQIAARGGTAAQVAGSAASGLTDPVNLMTGLIGGGEAKAARFVLTEAFGGAVGGLAMLPDQKRARDRMGEDFTPREMVSAVIESAAGNVALGLGGRYVAKPLLKPVLNPLGKAARAGFERSVSAGWDQLPRPLQERWAARSSVGGVKFKDRPVDDLLLADTAEALIGPQRMTPAERGAVTGLRRQSAYDAANPFVPDGAGMEAHRAGMGAAMARIMASDAVPGARGGEFSGATALSSGTVPVQAARPVARGPARSAVGFDNSVYQGLIARGLPEHSARGVAAGIHAESGSNPAIINPTSGARGYGQWLGPRKKALIDRYGPNPTKEQQLDFLVWELKGGDHGGKAVLSAGDETGALGAYVNAFMRPAKGAETSGDLRRGMAALGRGGEDVPAVPGGGTSAAGDAEALARDLARQQAQGELAAGEAAIGAPRGGLINAETAALGQPLGGLEAAPEATLLPQFRAELPHSLERVPARAINVDAETFQFKSGGDAFGVTERLANVDQWQPGFSGRVILWQGEDGRYFVADGHQRTGLARRIGAKEGRDISLDAYVLREADGISARDARTFAALKNIADDSGTITDMAKVLRDAGPQALREAGVPRSTKARHAEGAARLSSEAFGAVVNKVIPEEYGALIGARLPDNPETHMALVKLLADARPHNLAQADDVVRQGIEAGFFGGEQTDMFGSLDSMASLFTERARVKDAAMTKLRGLKRIFGTAAREADTLEGAGSTIDVAASTKEALSNDEALALIDKLAWSAGPVKDAIDRAARRLADGEPLARVAGELAGDIRQLDLRRAAMDGAEAGRDFGNGSTAESSAGSGLNPADGPGLPFDDGAQAQLLGFDEPLLRAAAADAQDASALHDLGMFAQANPETMIRPDADSEPMALGDFLRGLDEDERGLDVIDTCMAPGGATLL